MISVNSLTVCDKEKKPLATLAVWGVSAIKTDKISTSSVKTSSMRTDYVQRVFWWVFCLELNQELLLPSQLETQSIPALIIELCECCCSDENEAVTHSVGMRKEWVEAQRGRWNERESKGKRKPGREIEDCACETDEKRDQLQNVEWQRLRCTSERKAQCACITE